MAEQVVVCPKCNSRVSVPTEAIGRSVECLRCRETFVVPAGAEAEADVEAALLAKDRRRRVRRIVLWGAIAGIVALLLLAAVFPRPRWPDTPEGVARRFVLYWQRGDVNGFVECFADVERQTIEYQLKHDRDGFVRGLKGEIAGATVTVKDVHVDGDMAQVDLGWDQPRVGMMTRFIRLKKTPSGWRVTDY